MTTYPETYIRVTEPDGSQWISVTAFDEVLAALRLVVSVVEASNPELHFLSIARAAIAKAEGREPGEAA